MRISLIAAISENNVIGRDGELPWRLSADLRRFKRLTMGHHLIMGRKTFESIGRLLPGRTTIILSRGGFEGPEGAIVVGDLEAAIAAAAADDEVFVVGGGEVYAAALPRADRIYLTRVQSRVAGDAFFPDLAPDAWTTAEESFAPADERNEHPHTFQILDRKRT
mgnify:CR=1 FL=1